MHLVATGRRDPGAGTSTSGTSPRSRRSLDGNGREHRRAGVEAIADRRPSVSEQVERREVAELVTQILLTIERRARTVWTMRYLEGRSPDEVMAALDITHRQYSRLFERATTAINRKLVAYLAGDWCPGYASRFASLAAGRATAAQAEQAQEHLAACPAAAPRTRRSRGCTRVPEPRSPRDAAKRRAATPASIESGCDLGVRTDDRHSSAAGVSRRARRLKPSPPRVLSVTELRVRPAGALR